MPIRTKTTIRLLACIWQSPGGSSCEQV